MPTAVVECVDPIALSARLVESGRRGRCEVDFDLSTVPESILHIFQDDLIATNTEKCVFVTLGLFSIVKIERSVQLLIPAFDFCIPQKECQPASEEEPCSLFARLRFPIDEFIPPVMEDIEDLGQILPGEVESCCHHKHERREQRERFDCCERERREFE